MIVEERVSTEAQQEQGENANRQSSLRSSLASRDKFGAPHQQLTLQNDILLLVALWQLKLAGCRVQL